MNISRTIKAALTLVAFFAACHAWAQSDGFTLNVQVRATPADLYSSSTTVSYGQPVYFRLELDKVSGVSTTWGSVDPKDSFVRLFLAPEGSSPEEITSINWQMQCSLKGKREYAPGDSVSAEEILIDRYGDFDADQYFAPAPGTYFLTARFEDEANGLSVDSTVATIVIGARPPQWPGLLKNHLVSHMLGRGPEGPQGEQERRALTTLAAQVPGDPYGPHLRRAWRLDRKPAPPAVDPGLLARFGPALSRFLGAYLNGDAKALDRQMAPSVTYNTVLTRQDILQMLPKLAARFRSGAVWRLDSLRLDGDSAVAKVSISNPTGKRIEAWEFRLTTSGQEGLVKSWERQRP